MPTPPPPPIVTQHPTPNRWFYIRQVEFHQLLAELRTAITGWVMMLAVCGGIYWGSTAIGEGIGWDSDYLNSLLPDRRTREVAGYVTLAFYCGLNYKKFRIWGVIGLFLFFVALWSLPQIPGWIIATALVTFAVSDQTIERLERTGRDNHANKPQHA
jgi:hypothetical protein